MEKQIKYLKIYYLAITIIGIIYTIKLVYNLTKIPSLADLSLLNGLVIAMAFIPLVLLPYLAIKELSNYINKNKLKLNIILAVVFSFFAINLYRSIDSYILSLIPIMMVAWQIYMIYKIKKETKLK